MPKPQNPLHQEITDMLLPMFEEGNKKVPESKWFDIAAEVGYIDPNWEKLDNDPDPLRKKGHKTEIKEKFASWNSYLKSHEYYECQKFEITNKGWWMKIVPTHQTIKEKRDTAAARLKNWMEINQKKHEATPQYRPEIDGPDWEYHKSQVEKYNDNTVTRLIANKRKALK